MTWRFVPAGAIELFVVTAVLTSIFDFRTQKARTVSSAGFLLFFFDIVLRSYVFGRPCSDLLSQALRLSTIGAEEFDGRVRDGIGSWAPRKNHKVSEKRMSEFWFFGLLDQLRAHARRVGLVF